MPINSKEGIREETIEIKHVKDVVELWCGWDERDSAFGVVDYYQRGTLYHIYESEDEIFKFDSKGRLQEITKK